MTTSGTIRVDKVTYKVDVAHAFRQVLIVSDGDQPGGEIIVTALDGEILAEHTRPAPDIRYVGNGRTRGIRGIRPENPRVSPKS